MSSALVSVFIRGAFTEGLSDVYGDLKSVDSVGDRWSLHPGFLAFLRMFMRFSYCFYSMSFFVSK